MNNNKKNNLMTKLINGINKYCCFPMMYKKIEIIYDIDYEL